MTKILEIKNKIMRFYGEYQTFLFPVIKFIVALVVFFTINANIGFMEKITSSGYAVVLSLICALLPVNAIVWIAGIMILLNMYSLSLFVAIITLCVLFLIYLVYFRFAPKDGMVTVLTPILFRYNLPYIMPISTGLFGRAGSVVGLMCGTVFFYFIDGIKQNSSALVELSSDTETEITAKFNVMIGQIFNRPEMYLVAVVFALSALVVYFVRRIKFDHAWTLAIVLGTVIQLAGLFFGYFKLGITGKTVMLIVGSIISLLISFFFEFLHMNLDYERTERVQFEDDDYYYYVRAVPKKMVAKEEKVVKHFGNTSMMGKKIDKDGNTTVLDDEISRKVIAAELEVDEEDLK